MAILITNAPVKPAITFDRVHMHELRLLVSAENASKANVRIVYSLYGTDAEGNKHFDKAQKVLLIEDAYAEVASGNMALAQAMLGIEGAIAAILTQRGEYGTAAQG